MKATSLFVIGFFTISSVAFSQVYTTYHWHMQQPIYWPEVSGWNSRTYEKAYESMIGGRPHPENDLYQIFGWADRVAAYQYRVRDSIAAILPPNGGAQMSYSGCLVENIESLASAGVLGYDDGWENANREARSWLTSGGHRKLDIVIFPYHHALGPLVDEATLRKEIQIYKALYPQVWGPGLSTGYFPAELSFSERMIPVLVEEGIEWVFVPNNHLSRACANFPLTLGTGGEMCDPPNPADQINPPQANWFAKTIERGCTPKNAYPFAYQPHKAKHVDPETGQEYKITIVPVAQAMSWSDGCQQYGTGDNDQIAWVDDPMLIVLAHDGDNAYGGGYSYYMESVPRFCAAAAAKGYVPTVVEQYLEEHPVADWDVVHVEDGSWINADGDFGSPDFINWNWPLFNASGVFDIPGGWAEDERNWAVITAAQNRVQTAEQIAGGVRIEQIQAPTSAATPAELAWHFFLPSVSSCYMYYGTALDMEVKPTIACNNAIEQANLVIGDASQDRTPPTIWIPQQLPHNPGGVGFGSLWGYRRVEHARDFWVWTFVADVSGVSSVTFKYRLDNDGVNPLASNQNETFAGGAEVGPWISLPMQARAFPAGNVYNNPDIDFFEMPLEIADEYYIHVTEPAIVETGGVLVDYYIEAVDTKGFVKRSPILHTFVGTGDGGSSGRAISWEPENPEAGDTLSIYYDLTQGVLPADTDPVYIHIGHSGWREIITPDPAMRFDASTSRWIYEYAIPDDATSVDFVFNDGQGIWDNNGGRDWHLSVAGGNVNHVFVMDGQLDEGVQLIGTENGVSFYAGWNRDQLYVACDPAAGEDHFIFVSDGDSTMVPAPWAKSGQATQWRAYLGSESTNGWSGWFDGGGLQTRGSILEGVLDWTAEFGSMPSSVWLAFAAYETWDGGRLRFQIPAGNGDGSIGLSEFYELKLLGDLNFDGRINMKDFAVFARQWMEADCDAVNDWCGGADLNRLNGVDLEDLAAFAALWLNR